MPNLDGRGYYRTAYTAAQVTALRDDAWSQLRESERNAAFFDISEATGLGKLPLSLALSFVPKLLPVGDRFSVRAAVRVPLSLRTAVPDELRPSYEAWLRRTFGAAARRSGLSPKDTDTLDIQEARDSLIDAVANVARDPVLTAEAVKLAGHWRELPAAIRGTVLALAAHASPAVFDRLLADVGGESNRVRRLEMLEALAGSRDLKQQNTALALILDPKLDIRDTQFVLFGAHTEANRRNAQRFVMENKDAILKRIPSDGTTQGQSWLAYVFTSSCVPERRDEIAAYVTENFAKLQGGARTVQQAIEGMDQCIARHKLIEPGIRSWLAGEKPGWTTRGATAKAGKAAQ
jgi:hypothetical protein